MTTLQMINTQLTIEQIAKETGLPEATIRYDIKRGHLMAHPVSKVWKGRESENQRRGAILWSLCRVEAWLLGRRERVYMGGNGAIYNEPMESRALLNTVHQSVT